MKNDLLAVVSHTLPAEMRTVLSRWVSEILVLPPDPCLPPPVASHPDMVLFTLGHTAVVYRTYYDAARPVIDRFLARTGFSLRLSDHLRAPVYPQDVGLNALVTGTFLLARPDALAGEVHTLAAEESLDLLPVRQGYAACSAAWIAGTLCTADPSLLRAAQTAGLPVLPLPQTDILLPGYDRGFIGGCTGVWEDTVFFTGTPDACVYADLYRHLSRHHLTAVPLSSGPLTDCGGIRLYPIQH